MQEDRPVNSPEFKKTNFDRKVEFWKNQLMDLSKRNRMINYRESKRMTLRILAPEFSELFNRLAIGEEKLTFQRPIDRDTDMRVFDILSLFETLSYHMPVHIGDIKTESSVSDMQRTLLNLRTKSKLARDEQGINILYLSFGFIEWRGRDKTCLQSPLLMMPVSLKHESIQTPYILCRYDDEIEVNPTLDYLFNQEYGIDLPTFDLDNESSLNQYIETVENIVNKQGWKLIREASLGLVSFLKISMYHDVNNNRQRMFDNPIIRAITGDSDIANVIPPNFSNFNPDKISPTDCYQVVDSDSSQQKAIHLSKLGVSFVMQGPPGTGKSQTITNIIAEALACGKKVLFVSEKSAALDVVYKRLAEVQLSDFCLALHSHKANKIEILKSIGDNLGLARSTIKDSAMEELNTLFHDREYLNQYATALHEEVDQFNANLYTAFGTLLKLENETTVSFDISFPITTITSGQFNTMLYLVENYEKALTAFGCKLSENPWRNTVVTSISQDFKTGLLIDTQNLDRQLISFDETISDIIGKHGFNIPKTLNGASRLFAKLKEMVEIPLFPYEWAHAETRKVLLSTAKETDNLTQRYLSGVAVTREYIADSIYDIDILSWLNTVNTNISKIQQRGGYLNKSAIEVFSGVFHFNANVCAVIDNVMEVVSCYQKSKILLKHNLPDTYDNLAKFGHIAKALLLMQSILTEWDKDVFSMNYKAMLTRFRTKYTNIFKYFRPSYARDKKHILSLSKSTGLKIDDKRIIDLLQELKTFNEEISKVVKNTQFLDTFMLDNNGGFDTNWSAIHARYQEIFVQFETARSATNTIHAQINYAKELDELNTIAKVLSKFRVSETKGYVDRVIFAMNKSPDVSLENVVLPRLQELRMATEEIIGCIQVIKTHELSEIPLEVMLTFVETALEVKSSKSDLRAGSESCSNLFGSRYAELETEWSNIIKELEAISSIFAEEEREAVFSDDFIKLFCNDKEARVELSKLNSHIRNQYEAIQQPVFTFVNLFGEDSDIYNVTLTDLAERYNQCVNDFGMLEKWIDYIKTKAEFDKAGLPDFTDKINALNNTVADICGAFRKEFYRQWIAAVIDRKDSIRQFRRSVHEERITRFTKLDVKQLAIAQGRIREKIISAFPDPNRITRANDEVSILKHELQKKRRIMPLRKLFRSIPNLLLTLKPCFMMSPLSVAYFLEAESYRFDMIIFDEASQIFPHDAIGAISRGKQVIIAGDVKQLPPTNFFAVNTNNSDDYDKSEEDDDYEETTYDSILEETSNVLPSQSLLWHYRSKYEHLIAFSNQEFYNNELVTFPSSSEKDKDTGVEFFYVKDGYYESGGKNCNVLEAKRCVKLVEDHINKHPSRSLGIIAFSERQQQAIIHEVQRLRERHPEFEFFFIEDREDEFFVKNLENVQGDERDTIIFSVGYAKTKEQRENNRRMSMRFGPLGQRGGERRLNVAITRAKKNVKLVSSILPSDIDLSRTDSVGIHMLQAYIEFAISGSASLKKRRPKDENNDDFVDIVGDYITRSGYAIKKNVGCSGYKIDIAVEHPVYKDHYAAGIECDGISYAAAKTARDRDRLRKSVLISMGWNMYQVWSAEWVKNPETEQEKLIEFIRSALDNFQVIEVNSETTSHDSAKRHEMIELIDEPNVSVKQDSDPDNPYNFEYYKEAVWSDAHKIFRYTAEDRVVEAIKYIVGIEQPINIDLLYKRMAGIFGRQKVTKLVKDAVNGALLNKKASGDITNDGLFLTLTGFVGPRPRIPKKNDTPRPVSYISAREFGDAVLTVASCTFGLSKEGLISETVKALGYTRKNEKIMKCMDEAFSVLIERGDIRLVDGKVNIVR